MSTKKKPAASKGPQPLLKLKFDKFPDKQVAVYFEPAKRCFYADFGFEQYEAFSVGQLEGKIKAAIAKGARPNVEWVPVIAVREEGPASWKDPNKLSGEIYLEVERQYMAVTKKGLCEVEWNVQPAARSMRATESCSGFPWGIARKMRVFPKLPHVDKGNEGAILPYDESTWQKLTAIVGQFQAARGSMREAIQKLNFDSVFIPKAAAAPKKPGLSDDAKERAAANMKKRVAQPPSAVRSIKKEFEQVREAAGRHIVKKALGKSFADVREETARGNTEGPQQKLWAVLDAVVDVPQIGVIPENILRAAGFKAGTKGEREGNDFKIRRPHEKMSIFTLEHLQQRIRANFHEGKLELFEPAATASSASTQSTAGSAGKPAKKKSSGGAAQKALPKLSVARFVGDPTPLRKFLLEAMPDDHPLKLLANLQPGTEPQAVPLGIAKAAGFPDGANIDIWPDDQFAWHIPKEALSQEERNIGTTLRSGFLSRRDLIKKIIEHRAETAEAEKEPASA